ncbi:isocyanide synthase family protein [Breoghania sp.]|uniref:isocyanide synthase family protein n=1 Tax=Breoghania sp. TaxID=2065378 RepID=UPI002AA6A99D|nr:isocyanide synthase family protein [Breoghania sp.]
MNRAGPAYFSREEGVCGQSFQKDLVKTTEHRVFAELFERRNPIAPDQDMSERAIAHHVGQIASMVARGEPIAFVLPAFPGKSPNRRKTLSHLPDLAERLALQELSQMCEAIGGIHAPGAVVHVCSDGYVFSDLVHIPDAHVCEYTDELESWSGELYPGRFAYFDLKDAYPAQPDLDRMREMLTEEYGDPVEALSAEVKADPAANAMYRGITRFLYEDYKGMSAFAELSNTAIQKKARATAYRVIQRSNAWSALLAKRYPRAVRLSIHPQGPDSTKFGIKLVPCLDIWRTPWHSVAVKRDGQVYLERRADVEAGACRLMFRNGRPCHFIDF